MVSGYNFIIRYNALKYLSIFFLQGNSVSQREKNLKINDISRKSESFLDYAFIILVKLSFINLRRQTHFFLLMVFQELNNFSFIIKVTILLSKCLFFVNLWIKFLGAAISSILISSPFISMHFSHWTVF